MNQKYILMAFLVSFMGGKLFGQNLLSNGGFEVYKSKPKKSGDFELVDVNNPSASNSTSPDFFWGKRPHRYKAQPKSGKGMVGLVCYHDQVRGDESYREYVSLKLDTKMKTGKRYEISFWVTNYFYTTDKRMQRRNSNYSGRYFLEALGISFSLKKPVQYGSGLIEPDCYFQVSIDDYYKYWVQVNLLVEASSDFKYLTIGSFEPDSLLNLHKEDSGGLQPFAYYFIDDVSIKAIPSSVREKVVDCVEQTIEKDTINVEEPCLTFTEELRSLKKNESLVLEQINFEADSMKLSSMSKEYLTEVAKELINNPQINLEVGGHTSTNCGDSYCNKLSAGRAVVVQQFLIDSGVPASNLKAQGYGKTQLRYPMLNGKANYKNQRVELKVVDIKMHY